MFNVQMSFEQGNIFYNNINNNGDDDDDDADDENSPLSHDP
jgi:hypothetical protein